MAQASFFSATVNTVPNRKGSMSQEPFIEPWLRNHWVWYYNHLTRDGRTQRKRGTSVSYTNLENYANEAAAAVGNESRRRGSSVPTARKSSISSTRVQVGERDWDRSSVRLAGFLGLKTHGLLKQ